MPRARYLLTRRLGWWGVAITAWDIWRRIPKKQRQRIFRELRLHAPRVARSLAREAQRARDASRRSGRR